MTKEKQHVQGIDYAHYPENCDHCGMPARTEFNISDYPVGHEWFQFCTNFKCPQFDHSNLGGRREQMVAYAESSKQYLKERRAGKLLPVA